MMSREVVDLARGERSDSAPNRLAITNVEIDAATLQPCGWPTNTDDMASLRLEMLTEQATILTRLPDDETDIAAARHATSITGSGKIRRPPEARNSRSRSTIPVRKCQGSTSR